MSGAGAVVALVLLEWTVGWTGAAAWTQSWGVVARGHFRITAYGTLTLAALALIAGSGAAGGRGSGLLVGLLVALVVTASMYLAAQYTRTDMAGAIGGALCASAGLAALVAAGSLVPQWPELPAAGQLLIGAALLGAVTNGMLLGHWYLNQPGLKPWALGRLTSLALAATGGSAMLGLALAPKLAGAETPGAALGIPGFGESFGVAFYLIWLALVAFTGIVVWMARRCVRIRSIQSATGLYYVALLTAGVAEFLVRYLMVNAA